MRFGGGRLTQLVTRRESRDVLCWRTFLYPELPAMTRKSLPPKPLLRTVALFFAVLAAAAPAGRRTSHGAGEPI